MSSELRRRIGARQESAARHGRAPTLTVLASFVPWAFLASIDAQEYSRPERIGTLKSERLEEVSGIIPVTGREGYYWIHNDSGDGARIFAIHETGTLVARVKVTGAAAHDWEDIADGPGPDPARTYLFIGDTGNNRRSRTELVIYRIPQPALPEPLPDVPEGQKLDSEPAAKIRFRYPEGRHDCEAIAVHPGSGRIYLITKVLIDPVVYSCENVETGPKPQVLTKVATLHPKFYVTAADLSLDARRLLVRTYIGVEEFRLPEGKPFEAIFEQPGVALPTPLMEFQGESICYEPSDRGYVTVNEGKPKVIHRARRREPEPPSQEKVDPARG